MTRIIRPIIILLGWLTLTTVEAKTFFLGRIVATEPNLDLIVVEGQPVENARVGQVYDIVLNEEIYGKAKVVYVTDRGFDAKVIEGSIQEIHEVMLGQGEQVSAGFSSFIVIEVDEPQQAVLVFKSGKIKKVTVNEQLKEGFRVKDDKGKEILVAAGDLRTIIFSEEPKYRKFVKSETLVADVLPGEKEREKARILALQLKVKFKETVRLALGFINSSQFSKALKKADEAIKLKPKDYRGYYLKGRALMGIKKHTFAIAMFENALKIEKKPKELALIEYNLAIAHKEEGRLVDAKQWLEKSVDHGKDDLETTYLLASIQLEAGKFNEALSTTLWSLKKNKKGPKNLRAQTHARAAKLYLEKQYNLESAHKQIKIAMKLKPNDTAIKAINNRILIELAKRDQKQLIDVGAIGGAWKSTNKRLYVSFFEERLTMVVFRNNPISKNVDVIIIGGNMATEAEEELIVIENPKTQKFPVSSVKILKYSQVKKLSENFFSGEEEVTELEADIAFKVKDFTPLKLKILLDGKSYALVPMDTDE